MVLLHVQHQHAATVALTWHHLASPAAGRGGGEGGGGGGQNVCAHHCGPIRYIIQHSARCMPRKLPGILHTGRVGSLIPLKGAGQDPYLLLKQAFTCLPLLHPTDSPSGLLSSRSSPLLQAHVLLHLVHQGQLQLSLQHLDQPQCLNEVWEEGGVCGKRAVFRPSEPRWDAAHLNMWSATAGRPVPLPILCGK